MTSKNKPQTEAVNESAKTSSESALMMDSSSGGIITITGTSYDDVLRGGDSAEIVNGGVGDDEISGGNGDDQLNGGQGNDVLQDGAGSNTFNGGDGDDFLWSDGYGSGHDLLNGDDGNDLIFITAQTEATSSRTVEVYGGEGDDRITIRTRAESESVVNTIVIDGGAGRDTIDVDGAYWKRPEIVIINNFAAGLDGDVIDLAGLLDVSDSPYDFFGGNQNPFAIDDRYLRLIKSGSDTLLQFDADGSGTTSRFATVATLDNVDPKSLISENFIYTSINYDPTGKSLPSGVFIDGNPLSQVLNGNSSYDVIYGGGGNDTINGFGTADVLLGDEGDDEVNGGSGSDTLYGGIGNDVLNGGTDDDSLLGGWGDDELNGGQGNDVLEDDEGSDTFNGGDGNDYLVSTSGSGTAQVLNGDAGADQFLVNSLSLKTDINGGGGDDHILILSNNAFDYHGTEAQLITISTGEGRDVIEVDGGRLRSNSPATQVIVTDFQTGDGGDVIQLSRMLNAAQRYDGVKNPFELGYFRVVQQGENTLLQFDADAAVSRFGFLTAMELKNVNAAELISSNFKNPSVGQFVIQFEGTDIFDVINGSERADVILGQDGDDAIFSKAGADSLYGGDGNDTLDGGFGADVMMGGLGNDVYITDSALDMINELANEGVDAVSTNVSYTLSSNLENLRLTGQLSINGYGNALDNLLTGNSGSNTLAGFDGNDTLIGGVGSDTLIGGFGNDIYHIVGSELDAVIELSAEGSDTVKSTSSYRLGQNIENLILLGNYALNATGNELDNYLQGTSGDNKLSGALGNDTLNGGSGADTLVGGFGNDTYIVDEVGDLVVELENQGVDVVRSSIDYKLSSNIETLILIGASGVIGAGNDLNNLIMGNAENNSLSGSNGDDTLLGNAGNDVLNGGLGSDSLIGGTGHDTFVVDSLGDVVTEHLNQGMDTVKASVNYTLGINLENLVLVGKLALNGTGNALGNQIFGSALNNHLDGLNGNDSLYGDKGNDTIFGGLGNDYIAGGQGYDEMHGGLGNDYYVVDSRLDILAENKSEGLDTVESIISYVLQADFENLILTGAVGLAGTGNSQNNILLGNDGNNKLSGLDGNDTLDGAVGTDILIGGGGRDVFRFSTYIEVDSDKIYDFEAGKDRIDLSGIDSNDQLDSNQVFSFIGNEAFSEVAGELRFSTYEDGGKLEADINGDGLSDFQILLVASPASLLAADFIL